MMVTSGTLCHQRRHVQMAVKLFLLVLRSLACSAFETRHACQYSLSVLMKDVTFVGLFFCLRDFPESYRRNLVNFLGG